jgi:hypothetical protein
MVNQMSGGRRVDSEEVRSSYPTVNKDVIREWLDDLYVCEIEEFSKHIEKLEAILRSSSTTARDE